VYLDKVLSREYACGKVNERIGQVIESGGGGVRELVRRYVVGVEEGMVQRFWQSFGDKYKEYVKNRVVKDGGEGQVMAVLIEMFNKFKLNCSGKE
jgi:hypothetical protein